jgi:hypothetical protein
MNLKFKILFVSIIFFTTCPLFSQITTDQNGLKTTVIAALYANTTQARRYEIASVAYNSYHWQTGGLIIIELFEEYFGTGYEKYVLENGFGQGANSGSPILKLIDSNGINHSAKIVLGSPIDLTTSFGGYVNKQLPILLDVRYYAGYKVKITYIQQKVDVLTSFNQIKINDVPTGIDIPDFSVSTELASNLATSGNLNVTGVGNHFIKNGYVGIGTVSPGYKLDVIGTIRAREIKVDLTGADFVFENEYKLMPLTELEKFIKINKHLPEIATAKEMQESGANLGDLNTKLLQKIEELTLYTIEQNKKLEKQNEKILLLEDKVKTIELAIK